MPFYPTPDQDDGYDISDFYGVDPRLGTLGEFVEVVRTARDRGMRVIVDLVVNHTSDQHPWFQAARSDPDSPYRDWYVWADERPEDTDLTETFPGDQGGVWTYDRKARQYYLHRFYEHQPDLNVANPAVREEIARIVGFWLQLGVSGFRVDAVPFLIELDGIAGAPSVDPHRYLKDLRSFVQRRRGEAILLGEVNLPPKEQRGSSATRTATSSTSSSTSRSCSGSTWRWPAQDATPVERALADLPAGAVRLAVGHVPAQPRRADARPAQRRASGRRCSTPSAPTPTMQLYGRGPAPAAAADARRRPAAHPHGLQPAVLAAGHPVLFYGEEIGMGENLDVRRPLGGAHAHAVVRRAGRRVLDRRSRDGSPARSPRASTARWRSTSPPSAGTPGSLLNWFERLIRRRRETPELGLGTWSVIANDEPGGAGPPLRLGRVHRRRRAQLRCRALPPRPAAR